MEHPTFYRTIQIDGLSISYREAGPKEAPTLLLILKPMRPVWLPTRQSQPDGAIAAGGKGKHAVASAIKVNRNIAKLENIRRSLDGLGIKLTVCFDEKFHDRKIVVSNGWIIHLGRGLDIYKRPEDFLAVGATDFLLRPCHRSTVVYERIQPISAEGV